jgi:sortase A
MRALFFSVCIWLLVASGAFLASLGGLDYWESRSAQQEIAKNWDAEQPAPVPAAPEPAIPSRKTAPPPKAVIHTGATVAKLSIPRLETTLYVVEGTDDRDLKRGPGHLTASVLPGDHGNCVIAGHRDTHFRVLRNITKGDEVLLERNGQKFRYRVDGMTVVSPDNTASLQPTSDAVLNLITCYPFQYIGSAPKRFIVHAELESPQLSSKLSASR